MKKIFITLLCIFLLSIISQVNAGGSANFIQKSDKIETFNVEKIDGNNIKLSWIEYDKGEAFVDYILLKSKNAEKLNYPSNYSLSGLNFMTDKSVTSYTDNNSLAGIFWYKLCVVTKAGTTDEDGKINLNVRCSDKKTVSQVSQVVGLNPSLRAKLDRIIKIFFKKVEKKVKNDDKKIILYKKVNLKINKVKKRASKKKLLVLNYLQKQISKKIEELSLGDVEDLLTIDDKFDLENLKKSKISGFGNDPTWIVSINGKESYLSLPNDTGTTRTKYIISSVKKFAGEVTFNTAEGPFFVMKEGICKDESNGNYFDYLFYVYEGGKKTYSGCGRIEGSIR